MPDEKTRASRRRPIDVVIGQDIELQSNPIESEPDPRAQSPSGFMVEPPRPAPSVQAPPPRFPNDLRASAPPQPVTISDQSIASQLDAIAEPPKPATADSPILEKAEAVTFTPPKRQRFASSNQSDLRAERVAETRSDSSATTDAIADSNLVSPLTVAASATVRAPVLLYEQAELLELSQFVDKLYQNVAEEASDSPSLSAECLTNLNLARAAIEKGEYSRAESAAEQVKMRLLQARTSRAAASSTTMRLLFGWLLMWTLFGMGLFFLPLLIRVFPVIVPLLRGSSLGIVGGAMTALYQVPQHILKRDYDAACTVKYALSPILGGLLGAALYILSLLGVLAAPTALGITAEPFLLMYLFAFVAGLLNDVILGALRGIAFGNTGQKK
ncbi:MAG TPA: hypothetical protein VFD70_26285 [Anaerolineae bacterium]|nr:hypothetical protein [Anaerolineae bacterium]